MTTVRISKRLAFSGALLFLVGMLPGLCTEATLTGTVYSASDHQAKAR